MGWVKNMKQGWIVCQLVPAASKPLQNSRYSVTAELLENHHNHHP